MELGFAWDGEGTESEGSDPDALDPDEFERELAVESARLRIYLGRIAQGFEVDDLVQENLARALRYRASFDEATALWPWLKKIALRAKLDQRPLTTRPLVALAEDFIDFVTREAHPLEEQEAIGHMLRSLPNVEREILVRFHQGGDSIRQIGIDLELAGGTVKSHLHRARRRLAQENPGGFE